MDHQPLGRKKGSAHHPILVAKCALSRPADDVETHTPRHWKDAASRKIRLVAIESRSCFSLWKVNQKDHNLCAAAIVEQPRKKSSPGSTTFRSHGRQIYPSVTTSHRVRRFLPFASIQKHNSVRSMRCNGDCFHIGSKIQRSLTGPSTPE